MIVFVICGVVLAAILLGGMVFYAVRIETGALEVRSVRIRSPKIKKHAVILLVSDLHLHRNTPHWILSATRSAIRDVLRNRRPDTILLAGDAIDHSSGISLLPGILREFRSRLGTYAVLGNHDYIQYNLLHAFSPLFDFIDGRKTDLRALRAAYRAGRVRLLQDRTVNLRMGGGTVLLTGLDYLTYKKKAYGSLRRKGGGKKPFRILLSHYPDVVKYLSGQYDLIVSGHTHGGQVTLFGIPLITRSGIRRKHIRGASVHGQTILHVTKGVGVSRYVPFRFFARPDITVIELEASHD